MSPRGPAPAEGRPAAGWLAGFARATALGPALIACAPQPAPPLAADPRADQAPTGHTRRSIVTGQLDSGHPAVVGIGARRTDCEELLSIHCSGTLIAPQVVLTAAHCVADTPWGDALEVLFGSSPRDPQAQLTQVQRAVVHPTYRAKAAGPATGVDLALLLLLPPSDQVAAPPADIDRGNQVTLQVGDTVTLVGFGSTGPLGEAPGRKRTGTAHIENLRDADFRLSNSPSVSCHGDSGGPVFVRQGERELLVGVMTAGDPGCQRYGDNLRIDGHVEAFIAPFLSPGTVVSNVPSPPSSLDGPLCESPCSAQAPCPAGLRCQESSLPDGDSARCILPGLLPGTFGEACSQASMCGGSGERCVRLHAGQAEGACRCYHACGPTSASGCSIVSVPKPDPAAVQQGPRAAKFALLASLLGLLAALQRRPPRRARIAAGSEHR